MGREPRRGIAGGRPAPPVAGMVALALLAVACGAPSPSGTGRPLVVASFYPLYEAAVVVGGPWVRVTNLTPAGVEPHDLELAPPTVATLLSADVVVYEGGGFQSAVEAAVRQRRGGAALDVLAGLRGLRPAGGGKGAGGSVDPHVWLDPVLYREIVSRIAGALASVDPAHRQAFLRNAAAFRNRIGALDARYRTGLASCRSRVLVTAHAAWGYLAARYGLIEEPITGISPESEPDPRHLAELAALVHRAHVTTIFTETLVSPRVAEALARSAGVRTAVLDPLEGLTLAQQQAGATYLGVMGQNLEVLRAALGCGP